MTVIPFPAARRGLSPAALQQIADAAVRGLGIDRADAEAIAFDRPAPCQRQHNEHVIARLAWLLLQKLAASGAHFEEIA